MTDTDIQFPPELSSFTAEDSSMKVLLAAFIGVVMWDVINCLPSEVRFIFWPEVKDLIQHRKRPPFVSVLLFNSRVLSIALSVGFVCFAFSGTTRHSIKAEYMRNFLFSTLVIDGIAVFAIRTLAIRGSKKPMTIFTWFLFAIVSAAALWFPVGGRIAWLVFVACNIGFDIFVIIASILPQFEGRKWKPTYSRVSKQFYQDAIFYFSISLCVSMLVACSLPIFLGSDYACTIHFWLYATIPARVIRNLRLRSAKPKDNAITRTLSVDGIPLDTQLRQIKSIHVSPNSIGHKDCALEGFDDSSR